MWYSQGTLRFDTGGGPTVVRVSVSGRTVFLTRTRSPPPVRRRCVDPSFLFTGVPTEYHEGTGWHSHFPPHVAGTDFSRTSGSRTGTRLCQCVGPSGVPVSTRSTPVPLDPTYTHLDYHRDHVDVKTPNLTRGVGKTRFSRGPSLRTS